MIKYVSLGCNCSVSYHLMKLGLRKEGYPFDWCNTSYKNLIKVIKNDFKDYEKVVIKKFSDNHIFFDKDVNNIDDEKTNNGTYILKNGYGISFAHELTDKNQDDINKFEEKIRRRIERFRELKEENIIFIRIEINEKVDNYDELIETLDSKFHNYKIIIIGNIFDEKFSVNKKIEYYKLPEYKDWKYDDFNWNIICNKI